MLRLTYSKPVMEVKVQCSVRTLKLSNYYQLKQSQSMLDYHQLELLLSFCHPKNNESATVQIECHDWVTAITF